MTLAFLEGPEGVIVLIVILLLFGGTQLPKLARSLGEAQKEFRKGQQHSDDDSTKESKD